MTSDEIQNQIFPDGPIWHAKRVTKDNWKSTECHVVVVITRFQTDKHRLAEKSYPDHVRCEQHIGSKMQRTADENTA